ncbi:HAMP domain-containing histidine kinase [Undibacterium sp. Jales W-56]|uniref:sensor histidine kinase n=1 Tax=Undibacterium sp. Jales W-56 TaxID=2897325 RepID=UPI0021D1D217|nr:HAMP domain-containing sensor histidine kinase [Undibacterium sp. Jales W-56]MCU6433010.1 HAMP domain-containing histidine kinase [Undibacterium sp. Jales W-56]
MRSRLYLSFYLTLLACMAVYTVIGTGLRHRIGGVPDHVWSLVFGGLALIVSVGAYPFIRRLTLRLERLQMAVESLGEGDLQTRVAVEGRDEVAQLAHAFNRAAEKIESLVVAHKSLLSNASHELRTPLTRIRLTVTLMKESAEPRRRAELEQDIAELDALLDEILLASRLEAPVGLGALEEVDLLALVAEECTRYDDVELGGVPVILQGQSRLLRRLIRNLLENAKRYGKPPTLVELRGGEQGAELVVSDHGPGVAAEHLERVFEPFFRSPHIVTNTGVGLGLALVQQIARHHGGEARCERTDNGSSRFVIRLTRR